MGCGASSKGGKYVADSPTAPTGKHHQSWAAPPPEPRSAACSQGLAPPQGASADGRTVSYRRNHKANGHGSTTRMAAEVPNAKASSAPSPGGHEAVASPKSGAGPPVLDDHTSPNWEVQEFDKDEVSAPAQGTLAHEATVVDELGPAEDLGWDTCTWWGERAEWIYQRSAEILAAYNFFFEHIGLRKGWRVAPFAQEEVQAPFRAAAEVVVVVRAKLDTERGGVLVLRQVEGSAMNFLWGWSPADLLVQMARQRKTFCGVSFSRH